MTFGGSNRAQRVGSDRFGNPQVVKRLNLPRNNSGGASISGLAVAYVEIGGQLYQVAVTGIGSGGPKSDRHVGWVSITKRQRRQTGSL